MPPNIGPVPNGSAAESPAQLTTPPIVGINFGNSYASIAVFTKVRLDPSTRACSPPPTLLTNTGRHR